MAAANMCDGGGAIATSDLPEGGGAFHSRTCERGEGVSGDPSPALAGASFSELRKQLGRYGRGERCYGSIATVHLVPRLCRPHGSPDRREGDRAQAGACHPFCARGREGGDRPTVSRDSRPKGGTPLEWRIRVARRSLAGGGGGGPGGRGTRPPAIF